MKGLYKYEYNGEIIYIGKSDSSIEKRILDHEREIKFQPYLSKATIYYSLCKNAAETTILETYLIDKYKPILNVSMKYDDRLNFEIPEPQWFKFTTEVKVNSNQSKKDIVKRTKKWFENRYKKINDLENKINNLLIIEKLIEPYNGQYDIIITVPNTDQNEIYKHIHSNYSVHLKNDFYLCQLVSETYYDEKNIVVSLLPSELLLPLKFWDEYKTIFAKMKSEYSKEINNLQEQINNSTIKQ